MGYEQEPEVAPDEGEPNIGAAYLRALRRSSSAGDSIHRIQKLMSGSNSPLAKARPFEHVQFSGAAGRLAQDRLSSMDLLDEIAADQAEARRQEEARRREAVAREQHGLELTAELVVLQQHLVRGQAQLVERQDGQAKHARVLSWLEVLVLFVSVAALIVGIIAL